jgi:hypothetical protein
MLGLSLSTLSRAMDSQKIPKHKLGGRARKIAPLALLNLAVEYGADVAKIADEMMTIAERSHVAAPAIAATEQDIGAWFADQATQAPNHPNHREDRLAALIDAMRDAIGAEAAQDVLDRAGLTAADVTTSRSHPSSR